MEGHPQHELQCTLPRLSWSLPCDGYSWLKYGEKRLLHVVRLYFRCAEGKALGCKAKKLVDVTAQGLGLQGSITAPKIQYQGEHCHATQLQKETRDSTHYVSCRQHWELLPQPRACLKRPRSLPAAPVLHEPSIFTRVDRGFKCAKPQAHKEASTQESTMEAMEAHEPTLGQRHGVLDAYSCSGLKALDSTPFTEINPQEVASPCTQSGTRSIPKACPTEGLLCSSQQVPSLHVWPPLPSQARSRDKACQVAVDVSQVFQDAVPSQARAHGGCMEGQPKATGLGLGAKLHPGDPVNHGAVELTRPELQHQASVSGTGCSWTTEVTGEEGDEIHELLQQCTPHAVDWRIPAFGDQRPVTHHSSMQQCRRKQEKGFTCHQPRAGCGDLAG